MTMRISPLAVRPRFVPIHSSRNTIALEYLAPAARHGNSTQAQQKRTLSCGAVQSHLTEEELKKEEHKYYDEAVICVRAGKGGDGEIISEGSGKYVKNYKYNPGRNSPKTIWLPAGAPADGAAGGDVVLSCDPSLDTLSHFHLKSTFVAKKGPNGNPEEGSQGSKALSREKRPKWHAPPCTISVPPGTVVKRKGSGRFLGELLSPRDRLTVARGGQGGYGIVVPSRKKKRRPTKKRKDVTVETVDVEESNWRVETRGLQGEEVTLQLLLRVVADVGFVGLPNAGKSALLAALSRARPEIAPYPFTTLIPNLGVMGRGGDPVLVDLPGLIEGAHVGRGLGRNFLRHLRRTRILLQVVDASLPDPVTDYETIREELRMYNPEYCEQSHLVTLSKIDLVPSVERLEELRTEIQSSAERLRQSMTPASLPECIIPTSAVSGVGVDALQKALQDTMRDKTDRGAEESDSPATFRSSRSVDFDSSLTWEED